LRGAVFTVPMLVLSCLCSLSQASEHPELEGKTRELEQIKARIQQLRGQLSLVETERQAQNYALSENEKQIGLIARRIRVVGLSLERQRRRLAELELERADAYLQLDQHRQVVERQLRAAYIMGRQEKLKILLKQQDPAVVSRLLVYYDYLNAERFAQMREIQAKLQSLAKLEQEISEEEQRQEQLFTKEEAEKQQLELAGKERERIIATLNLQLRSKEQELEGLQANEKQLQSLLLELQDVMADIPLDPTAQTPFITRKGKLPWPAKGHLSASFGSTREVGKLRWDGVLIEAPEGEEVRSVHYGRVAFADWLRGFGLLLIIDHGDGYMSLYGYNQSLFKETGEWVEAGEVIAQVGNSGGRSSPGVYFGLRHNGEPIDPKGWCKRIKGRQIGHLFPAGGPSTSASSGLAVRNS
jgi:septal ring factor EnvC (AmiA/AmiB activator)